MRQSIVSALSILPICYLIGRAPRRHRSRHAQKHGASLHCLGLCKQDFAIQVGQGLFTGLFEGVAVAPQDEHVFVRVDEVADVDRTPGRRLEC